MRPSLGLDPVFATRRWLCAIALLLLATASTARAATTYAYPLKMSANGRYLVDQNGTPFRMQGEAAWSMIANLTYSEANTYLDNRRAKGFNTVLLTNGTNNQTVCRNFGNYLGTRYRNRKNIVWIAGGDYTPPPGSEGETRLHKILEGIQPAGATQPQAQHHRRHDSDELPLPRAVVQPDQRVLHAHLIIAAQHGHPSLHHAGQQRVERERPRRLRP